MIGFTPDSLIYRHLHWCLARLQRQEDYAEMLARKVRNLAHLAERYEELLQIQAARHDVIVRDLERQYRAALPNEDDSDFTRVYLPAPLSVGTQSSPRRPSGLHENQTSDAKAPPPKSEQPDE